MESYSWKEGQATFYFLTNGSDYVEHEHLKLDKNFSILLQTFF